MELERNAWKTSRSITRKTEFFLVFMATKEDFPLVCSLETLKHVVLFLDNYAEEHAVALPGRVPGFKRTDVRLLPSSNTKASIHRVYEQAAVSAGVTAVSYPKFVEMWNKLRPQMRITKPMTDLCHTCQ